MFQFRLSAKIEISLSQFFEFTLIIIQIPGEVVSDKAGGYTQAVKSDLTGDGSLILDEIQGFQLDIIPQCRI